MSAHPVQRYAHPAYVVHASNYAVLGERVEHRTLCGQARTDFEHVTLPVTCKGCLRRLGAAEDHLGTAAEGGER